MAIQGYITQKAHKQIIGDMENRINDLEQLLSQMVAPHDHTSVSSHNDILREENTVLRIALEEIYLESEDNWAAARAETALGRGKIVVFE